MEAPELASPDSGGCDPERLLRLRPLPVVQRRNLHVERLHEAVLLLPAVRSRQPSVGRPARTKGAPSTGSSAATGRPARAPVASAGSTSVRAERPPARVVPRGRRGDGARRRRGPGGRGVAIGERLAGPGPGAARRRLTPSEDAPPRTCAGRRCASCGRSTTATSRRWTACSPEHEPRARGDRVGGP